MKPKYERFKKRAFLILLDRGPLSGHDLCYEVQLVNRNVNISKQSLPWLLGSDNRFIMYRENDVYLYDVAPSPPIKPKKKDHRVQ